VHRGAVGTQDPDLTASARLGRKLEFALPGYGVPLRLLLDEANAREIFPRCLLVAYHVSRSMVPLMEAALERARDLAPDDPVAAGLASYLERHIPEEMHSDEHGGAVVDDLAALGFDPDEVRALPTTPQVEALVAAQLEWMHSDHPVTILGFLELEAHQADRPTVERLIQKTGLPRDAFGQLLLHSRLEPVHARELHRVLDSLPLADRHERLIGLSALRTMAFITDAFLEAVGHPVEAPAVAR
jgi:Iron-containing redox enzyme